MYTLVTVTKIIYVTVDARLYTQGKNKTQKSCTVLIEGKDTHNCKKKVRKGIVLLFKNKCMTIIIILRQPTSILSIEVVLPFEKNTYYGYPLILHHLL